MNTKDKIRKILSEHGTTWQLVKSSRREAHLVECRKDIIRMLREQDKKRWSYPAIGRLLNRDHTSIMHLATDERRQKHNSDVLERYRNRQVKFYG